MAIYPDGTGNNGEGVFNCRFRCGSTRSTSCEIPQNTLKTASLNVGTMKGRYSEIVETITRRQIDLCYAVCRGYDKEGLQRFSRKKILNSSFSG